jgi:hypothetical protein
MRNDLAQRQLADAHAQTQAILADQSTYAEGTRAVALVEGIRAAQIDVTGNEILWESVLMQIAAMMPAGTDFGSTIAVGQAPWEPALSVEGPLRSSRLAVITINFVSPTMVDPAGVVPKLSTLPGYVDSRFDSSIWDETYLHYVTTVRVMFDHDAVSNRFTDASGDDSETDTEVDAEAAGTDGEGAR